MKVKEFLKPFTDRSVFRLRGDLYTAQHLRDLFGDFEVVTVDSDHIVTLVIDEPTCDCYEVTKERRYLTEYEKAVIMEDTTKILDMSLKKFQDA